MFKEKCPHCNKSIERKFAYCPYCGVDLEEEREIKDFGLLGKEDSKERGKDMLGNAFGFSLNLGDIFNSVNSIAKNLTKELEKNAGEPKMFSKAISINLSPGKTPEIKVHSGGKQIPIGIKSKPSFKLPKLQEERLKDLSKLKKEEPETEVRRLGDRIVYEINVPGVQSKEDIMINRLETGVQVIALAKEKAYIKKIPIRLNIIKYKVEGGKLILEFKP